MKRQIHRREFIEQILSAYSFLGLRSLLLGVSPAFLTSRLMANEGDRKFLIFSSEAQGSPLNCNVPGTYGNNGLQHPGDASMSASNFSLGNAQVRAASPWANLPLELRNQLHFIHNRTEVNAHNEFRDVLYGLGRVKNEGGSGSEMIASVVAQENAASLGTIMDRPFVLDSELDYKGSRIRKVSPDLFQSLFGAQGTQAANQMMKFRDQALDSLYADIKEKGTHAQKDFLEDAIKSRQEARALSEKLSEVLGNLPNNEDEAAVLVAAVVCFSGAAPVVNLKLSFGGDNHGDSNLADETSQTVRGTQHLAQLHTYLSDFGITDKVVFALQNTFGRTLRLNPKGGRDHNNLHNVTLLFGANVKPGVSGGIEVIQDERGARAAPFNSDTGRVSNNGDITPATSLVSSIKTIYKACGLPAETIEKRVQGGKIIKNAVS